MHYAFFLECQLFLFSVSIVLFSTINVGSHHVVLEGDELHFSLPRILHFSLLSFNERSLFLLLRLDFVFCLDFCSDLVISLYQGVFGPLVYVDFPQKSCFEKV
jgi:hypothetical protein